MKESSAQFNVHTFKQKLLNTAHKLFANFIDTELINRVILDWK